MSTTRKNTLRNVMTLAWQFIKRNGLSLSEAMTIAWRNIKLRTAMAERICKFYFQKVDGTLREAYGTLSIKHIPSHTDGDGRKKNDTIQVYYDTEKQAWRSFKKANLMKI